MRSGAFSAAQALVLASLVFAPAARAEAAYESEVQYALEKIISGVSTAAVVNGTKVTITPLRTWRSVSGHYCREYRLTLAKPGSEPDRNRGVRCRESTGKWSKIEQD